MEKMNFSNSQTAFEYALYMIATSYFKSAKCENKILEKNMLLQYREQKKERQYRMEEFCINYMDKLRNILPWDIEKQDVRVFLRRKENGNVEVVLKGKEFILTLNGVYAVKKPHIQCKCKTGKLTGDNNMAA